MLSIVDAFTDKPFAGNPAAVCVLETPRDETWMQALAAEMNLSETAFVYRQAASWNLRWFTPTREVDLCGHATLATAHVLWEEGHVEPSEAIAFHTRSGPLHVRQEGGRIVMDFPAAVAVPEAQRPLPEGMLNALWPALGVEPVPVFVAPNENILLVLPDKASLDAVSPDFAALLAVSKRHGFILSSCEGTDVFTRYFVPAWGINEDPVTGSIQCTLGPYWCGQLGLEEIRVEQRSSRGGVLLVRPMGERVQVAGSAVTVLRGALSPAAEA